MKQCMEQVKSESNYQQMLEAVRRLEPAFLVLWDSLTREQRQILEDYLSACEALDQELLANAARTAGEQRTEELYYLLKLETTYKELRRQIRENGPAWQRACQEEGQKQTPQEQARSRRFQELAQQVMAEEEEQHRMK